MEQELDLELEFSKLEARFENFEDLLPTLFAEAVKQGDGAVTGLNFDKMEKDLKETLWEERDILVKLVECTGELLNEKYALLLREKKELRKKLRFVKASAGALAKVAAMKEKANAKKAKRAQGREKAKKPILNLIAGIAVAAIPWLAYLGFYIFTKT